MADLSPPTELLMATYRIDQGTERLARAVAALDGLMLAPSVAALRDAAQAWLNAPGLETAERLERAVADYCRSVTPPRTPTRIRKADPRVTPDDLAALAEPSWAERADLR